MKKEIKIYKWDNMDFSHGWLFEYIEELSFDCHLVKVYGYDKDVVDCSNYNMGHIITISREDWNKVSFFKNIKTEVKTQELDFLLEKLELEMKKNYSENKYKEILLKSISDCQSSCLNNLVEKVKDNIEKYTKLNITKELKDIEKECKDEEEYSEVEAEYFSELLYYDLPKFY